MSWERETVTDQMKPIEEFALRLLTRLRGRQAMNERTSNCHPDKYARMVARIRADAYAQAMADVKELEKDILIDFAPRAPVMDTRCAPEQWTNVCSVGPLLPYLKFQRIGTCLKLIEIDPDKPNWAYVAACRSHVRRDPTDTAFYPCNACGGNICPAEGVLGNLCPPCEENFFEMFEAKLCGTCNVVAYADKYSSSWTCNNCGHHWG